MRFIYGQRAIAVGRIKRRPYRMNGRTKTRSTMTRLRNLARIARYTLMAAEEIKRKKEESNE